MSRSKPIFSIDFDGVIHAYTSGWQGVGVVADGPVPGAALFLAELVQRFSVHVYSSRSSSPEGIRAMKNAINGWLIDELGPDSGSEVFDQLKFPTEKPAALVGLDDRVVTFTGVWPCVDDLAAFKPWNKK